MIGAAFALALMLAVGVPLALALPGRPRRLSAIAGEGYLLGSGAVALLLMVLSIAGVRWSMPTVVAGSALIAALAIFAMRRQALQIEKPQLGWPLIVDLCTLLLIVGFIRYATLAPSTENDYLLIWGVKAREFWLAQAIDWRFLETPLNANAHLDYPILLPLVFDVQALVTGSWPENWLGLVTASYGVAALLVVRGMLEDEIGDLGAALAALVLMPLLFSPYLGLAEGPLIAYSVAALLLIRHAMKEGRGAHALHAGILLGFAASSKNEGVALILAVVIALVVTRRSDLLPRLWPAIVIPMPWWILRAVHQLPADLLSTGFLERLRERVLHPAPIFHALTQHPVGQPLFWLGVTAACAIGWRRIATTERFLAVVILLQLLFFIGAYFVTPHDIVWHVRWSWERIVRQLMPAVALLALFSNVGSEAVDGSA
jgi:hypothetical protein